MDVVVWVGGESLSNKLTNNPNLKNFAGGGGEGLWEVGEGVSEIFGQVDKKSKSDFFLPLRRRGCGGRRCWGWVSEFFDNESNSEKKWAGWELGEGG